MFIKIYFRMHHFVVKLSKFFFASGGKGAFDPANQNPADVPGCHCTTTSQVVRRGPNSSFGAKGRFRRTHAISDAPVQPLVGHRLRTCSFTDSVVTPILKKSAANPSSYRPILNLSVISNVLERLVVRQFVTYLDANCLLPTTQSRFRRGYSTETATICFLSNLRDAVDRDDTAVLVLLDLSAEFDTVDRGFLLKRLQVTFDVDNSALACFRSYLASRQQHVRCGGKRSALCVVTARRSTGVDPWADTLYYLHR